MVFGKLDLYVQNNETRPLSYTTTKITLKWIKDLNVRPKTIKIVEENIGSKILDIAGSNIFSGYIFIYPRQMKQKKKINRTTSN